MIATTTGGQLNCGKIDFSVGEIGNGVANPFSGATMPTGVAGDFIVGFDIRMQTDKPRVRCISAVYMSNFAGEIKTLNYNVGYCTSGTIFNFRCTEGHGLCGLRVWGSVATGRIGLWQRNLSNGDKSYGPEYGCDDFRAMGQYSDLMVSDNGLVVKLAGRFNRESGGSSGDRLCNITLFERNFAIEFAIMARDSNKRDACMGLFSHKTGYVPQSGTCDKFMTSYCAYSADKSCGCINSKVVGTNYNPICVDSGCSAGGYATASMIRMRGSSCPNIVSCKQVFELQNYGLADLRGAEFIQNCGNNTYGDTPNVQSAQNVPAAVTYGEYSPEVSNIKYFVLIFIIVLIIAIFGTGIYLYWDELTGDNSSTPDRKRRHRSYYD